MSLSKDPLEIIAKLEKFFKENQVDTTVKHQGDEYVRIYGKCEDGVQVHVTIFWSEQL